jgi:hypothetical protein
MLKFPTDKGVATVQSMHIPATECSDAMHPDAWHQDSWKMVDEVQVVIDDEYPEQTVRVGGDLSYEQREELKALLKRHKQAFAWKPQDMTGVSRSVIEHKLNIIPTCKPIKQKKRGMARDRNDVVNKEVADLVAAGVMRPTQFPEWVGCTGEKRRRLNADVCRLHRLKQSLPERQLPSSGNRTKG